MSIACTATAQIYPYCNFKEGRKERREGRKGGKEEGRKTKNKNKKTPFSWYRKKIIIIIPFYFVENHRSHSTE